MKQQFSALERILELEPENSSEDPYHLLCDFFLARLGWGENVGLTVSRIFYFIYVP